MSIIARSTGNARKKEKIIIMISKSYQDVRVGTREEESLRDAV